VRERGLEPPPLAGPDPKSGASAISPLAQIFSAVKADSALVGGNEVSRSLDASASDVAGQLSFCQ
jgi:hypothetical protein